MALETLALALLPIILFAVVELKFGAKAGAIAAIVVGIAIALYMHFRFGAVDTPYIVELLLIVGLGALSIKLQNSKYFKMQPLIVGVVFTVYIFTMQLFYEPVFLHMLPLMSKMLPPEQAATFQSPEMRNYLSNLSWQTGILIFLHALTCGWAAIKLSSMGWVLVRLAIYPALIALMVLSKAF